MPDDHSKSVPPLPIPNRTVKRLCADDSAATSVKVGYRQASYKRKPASDLAGFFAFRTNSVEQVSATSWLTLVLRLGFSVQQRLASIRQASHKEKARSAYAGGLFCIIFPA